MHVCISKIVRLLSIFKLIKKYFWGKEIQVENKNYAPPPQKGGGEGQMEIIRKL